nr:HIT family protein [Paenibacillus sp. YPG26]
METEYSLAFFDIYPATLGHLLVIPKNHIPYLHLLGSEEIQADLFRTLIKACNMLVNSNLCSDYEVIQSNGPYADQDVEHIHFHIIPRYSNDHVHIELEPYKGMVSTQELNELANLINDPNHKKT